MWDTVGNVYERGKNFYDTEYFKDCPSANPKDLEGGQERGICGSSLNETWAPLRTTHRTGSSELSGRNNIGFRLAMEAGSMRPGG